MQSEGEGGVGLGGFASSLGSASDMAKFGGQLRCPTCRCLQSSLMEMSSGNLNPKFPTYGLCYRTNCAMDTYLQVGVRGQLDGKTYWYACPTGGASCTSRGTLGPLPAPPRGTFAGWRA